MPDDPATAREITVTPNGPYLVSGDLPVVRRRIVMSRSTAYPGTNVVVHDDGSHKDTCFRDAAPAH